MAEKKLSELTVLAGTPELSSVLAIVQNGHTLSVTVSQLLSALVLPEQQTIEVAVFRDEKPANSRGGSFVSGAWRTRDVNTLECSGDWCLLSNNQLILTSGTYLFFCSCPAFAVRNHQAGLYNVSAGAFVAMGTVMYTYESYAGNNQSHVTALLSLSEAQIFEIRHQGYYTRDDDGFGVRAVFEEKGVYTEGVIIKL